MDYEKKYKEALERAEEIIKYYKEHNRGDETSIEDLENVFPELKESEDERIRKALLEMVHDTTGDELWVDYNVHKEEALAWLEKQGESSDQIHYWTEEEIEPIISDYLRGAEHYGGMIGRLRCLKPKSLEKQGESSIKWNKNTEGNKPHVNHSVLMKTIHGIAEGEWKGEYWEQYRWAGIVRDSDVLSWMELSDLEKQGEQKPFDYENANIQQKDFAPQEDAPRYSIGDVLCDKSCTTLNKDAQPNFEIVDIRNGMYICDKGSFPISQQDEYELVAKKIEQKPFDYENANIQQKDFAPNDEEMRELLRTEYEKDRADAIAEMQKDWSEEDDYNLQCCIAKVQFDIDNGRIGRNRQLLTWLKSLKERVQPQLKQEWSEEDEEELDIAISTLKEAGQHDSAKWLKSLKERYTWKPSDEQMHALHDLNLTGNISYAGQGQELINLYNDLKKLKGE